LIKKKIIQSLYNPDIPKVYYELLYIGFSIVMGMSLSASFLPILADSLDPSGVLVGLVISAWFLSRIFIELPAGIISERLGRSKVIVTGLGMSLLGSFLCSQAQHIYVLILGRGIWGRGTALYFMSNMALLMDILPASTRGKALGIFQGTEFIGSFIGAPLGAWLSTYLSFTGVFYVTTLFTIISFVIAFRSKEIRSIAPRKKGASLNLEQISTSLRNWTVITVCVINLFRMFMRVGLYRTARAHIGWIVGFRIAGMVIFLFIAGVLSDRFGRKPVLVAGYIMSSISLLFYSISVSLPFLFLTSFIGGISDGLDMTTLTALLTDIAPIDARGAVVGLFRTFQDIGGFMGPLLFMMVYMRFGQLAPFYTGIILCFLNIILVTRIKI
jgi:MFS family permease